MKKNGADNTNIAGKIYDVKDYHKEDEVSAGLSSTHEQASDTMTEGTIDGVMENVAGKDIPLQKNRK